MATIQRGADGRLFCARWNAFPFQKGRREQTGDDADDDEKRRRPANAARPADKPGKAAPPGAQRDVLKGQDDAPRQRPWPWLNILPARHVP
ncbi:MAG TPA: hypothetical protein VKV96_07395 [Roseiarcus sp.]|nr:hypothetical protein [Roseiarcus sp.]